MSKMKSLIGLYLELINPKTKKILKLYYKDNVSMRMIGKRLGYSEGTVKNKKSKAIKVLADRLNLKVNENNIKYIGERIRKTLTA